MIISYYATSLNGSSNENWELEGCCMYSHWKRAEDMMSLKGSWIVTEDSSKFGGEIVFCSQRCSSLS